MEDSHEETSLRSRLERSEELRELPFQVQIEEKVTPKWKRFEFEFLFLPLPFIAMAMIIRFVYIASTPDLLTPPIALFVGLVIGIVAIAYVMAMDGHTLMEVGTGSLIIIVILGCGWNMPAQMNQTRQINKMKREIKQRELKSKTARESFDSRAVSSSPNDYSLINLLSLSSSPDDTSSLPSPPSAIGTNTSPPSSGFSVVKAISPFWAST